MIAALLLAALTHGNLEEHVFQSRKVWIYTPPGYASSAKNHLLVLFDGDSYRSEIPAPAILDELITRHAIPPTVAVLVDTSENRIRDLDHNKEFADFVAKELVPWVRSKWRVDDDPKHAVIGGYSAGGLGAAYVAFEHSEVFGNVLSQSGAFWRHNEGMTAAVTKSAKRPVRFYLDIGALETHKTAGGPVFIETVQRLRDALEKKGYAVQYVEWPDAYHNEVHWRASFPEGLKALLAQ